MKRIITYLYEYHNGKKGNNIGFLKVDLRGTECRVQLHIQTPGRETEKGSVYLVARNSPVEGVLLGEIMLQQGSCEMTWRFSRLRIRGSSYELSQIMGAGIMFPSGRYLASSWVEEPSEELLRGTFRVWKEPEKNEGAQRSIPLQPKKKMQPQPVQTAANVIPMQDAIQMKHPRSQFWTIHHPEGTPSGDAALSAADMRTVTKLRPESEMPAGADVPGEATANVSEKEEERAAQTTSIGNNLIANASSGTRSIEESRPEPEMLAGADVPGGATASASSGTRPTQTPSVGNNPTASASSGTRPTQAPPAGNNPTAGNSLAEASAGEERPPEESHPERELSAEENMPEVSATERSCPETATSAEKSCLKRIDINYIKKLPKRNWYLCNNSFLIHGFFNYHYLVLKEVEENGMKKLYLGVPGIFEKPERAMALLFGFPEFAAAQPQNGGDGTAQGARDTQVMSHGARDTQVIPHGDEDLGEVRDGTFGYWFCLLDT